MMGDALSRVSFVLPLRVKHSELTGWHFKARKIPLRLDQNHFSCVVLLIRIFL